MVVLVVMVWKWTNQQVVVDFPDLGLQDSWPVERLQELFLSCPPDSSEVEPHLHGGAPHHPGVPRLPGAPP